MLKHIVRVIHAVVREKITKVLSRSSGWPTVRKNHLKRHSFCEACGSTKILQVHHKIPFHDNPALELNEYNLMTLCMSKKECHIHIGHGDSYRYYNPNAVKDAARCLANPGDFDKIAKEAEANRK